MRKTEQEKVAALHSLRKELGPKIVLAGEWEEKWENDSGKELSDQSGERREGALGNFLFRGPARGQVTEIVGERGGGLVLTAMLAKARRERRYLALLDVGSGFDVESVPETDLEGLLWVGCRSPKEAVEALDIVTRDENFSLFLVDLRGCLPADWKGLRAAQWYRILGQLRQRDAAAVLFAREAVTTVAKRRLRTEIAWSCEDMERERSELWKTVALEPAAAGSGNREKTREWETAMRAG
ncbi:MAG: hypothetical protein AAGC68_01035 [Verrucomicrobiota bacterium]